MEKKKNIIIGILIAIIFLLIGLIFAILIMTKGKENSDKDNKSTSTSTQTLKTSKVSETTTIRSVEIEEYEKKLNENAESLKPSLVKKYNLQRKMIADFCLYDTCVIEIKYLYNNKEIISSYIEDIKIGDMSILTDREEIGIREFYDNITHTIYYAVYDDYDGEGLRSLKIFTKTFDLLNGGDITFCPPGIFYKNGDYIYDNYSFKFVNNKTIDYVISNSDVSKVLFHKLTVENGIIKDIILKEDSADNYGFAGILDCEDVYN